MTTLDVIIVSYNTRDHLEACLRALLGTPPQLTHEITVVDNGSVDGSVECVRSSSANIRLIEAGRNIGYARANNLAIRQTSGELILLLNSDTVVPPGALDELVSILSRHDDVVAVGPRLVDSRGRPELSFGRMIGPFNELIQKIKSAALTRQMPLISSRVERSLKQPGYPEWVSGACLLVRRETAEAVGLLDERFFLYGEDVDFCCALRRRGGRILFAPEVEVVHHGGQSGVGAPEETRAFYRRSQLAFYAKHHPAWVSVLRLYLRLRGQLPRPQAD